MITKEKFENYVKVQASGVCNMWSIEVEQLANITKEEHLDIIGNYETYKDKYNICIEDYLDE